MSFHAVRPSRGSSASIALFAAAIAAPAWAQSCPSLGVPISGVPGYQERIFHVLGNAARISPASYATTVIGNSTIMQTYPSVPPLTWDAAAGAFAHNFTTSIATGCPSSIPTHNSCGGTPWSSRAAAAGLCGLFNELVSGSSTSDPLPAFNLLLTETPSPPYPADHTTDLHRQVMLSPTPTTLGCGYALASTGLFRNFWVIDFQGSCTPPPACGPLHSGSHLVRTTTLDFLANFYEASNQPPRSAMVFVDGVAQTMTPYLGTAARGTYKATQLKTNACRSYYFEFVSSNGTTYRYPGTGFLRTFGDNCAEDYKPAKVVINEIDYDQPGTDTAEFIELKNVSGGQLDLTQYSIELWNGANNTIYSTINLTGAVPTNGYYVISTTGSSVPNVNQRVAATQDYIQNGAPDGLLIRFLPSGEVIDSFCYEGAMAGLVEGTPLPATPADDNVTANLSYSRYPDGVDTNITANDWQLKAITPGTSNSAPVILQQPGSVTVCLGATASFSIGATGAGPFAYRWQWQPVPAAGWSDLREGINLYSGQPALDVTGSTATPMQARVLWGIGGNINIRCIVSNATSVTTSSEATLTVCACLACPADFNQDGGIDGTDVSAFFDRWEVGQCDADVNQDGGVDGGDVDVFFAAWENGGC